MARDTQTIRSRAWQDFHRGLGKKVAISLAGSLMLGLLTFLAVDRYGSADGANDALIAVVVVVVTLITAVIGLALWNVVAAPHRILKYRVAFLEQRTADAAHRVPAPRRPIRKVADVNYQAEQLMQIVQSASHWGMSSFDQWQLNDALAGGHPRKDRDEAYEPLTADAVRLGIDALVSKGVWHMEDTPDGVVYYWDPAKYQPPDVT